MTEFLIIVTPFLIVLAALSIVDLFGRDYGGWAITAWVACIVCFPVLGSLAYWLTRRAAPESAEQVYLAQADLRRERERLPIDRSGY
ncbi:PLDc N-terminal domain-containing protein [Solirubrobacter phytolaccae]|uniref:PLDc N-terminal domain-containing protein n=1 Tax=Solirubrobacter phytolaccae TaxID=1404360 RepID=A0A9X3S8E8_9ACTN|nr:PLDc N-terminal domain-containing protein [Solirubrobacter phytolaccae]MDA0181368.1 PLDc N-terminal domain-containing protein [Solirubrobacter phytolaccae]